MKTSTLFFVVLMIVISVAALLDIRVWWAFDDATMFGGGGKPAFATPADEGKYLFGQKCVTCHTVGGGKLVGPDLKDVTTRREKQWVLRFIMEPDVMVQKDPEGIKLFEEFKKVPMTNLGISVKEAEALYAFLEGPKKEVAPVAEKPVVGDAVTGQKLFTGATPFSKGGPSCMTCHSVGGTGRFGGGSLGPDLTNAVGKFKADGMAGLLKGLPFPTMQPVYRNKSLTAEEQAHLLAFFTSSDQQTPRDFPWHFLLIGVAGFVLGIVVPHVVWMKRSRGVRQPLLGGRS